MNGVYQRPCNACAIVGDPPSLHEEGHNGKYEIITATCLGKDGEVRNHTFHKNCAWPDGASDECPAYEFEDLSFDRLNRNNPKKESYCGGRITHVNGMKINEFLELVTEYFV